MTFQARLLHNQRVPIPKRAVFERSRRELSLDVSVGVHILLVVEQLSLESQSRGCAKTPILTVLLVPYASDVFCIAHDHYRPIVGVGKERRTLNLSMVILKRQYPLLILP